MTTRTFQTYEVLAAMHNFAGIICAKHPQEPIRFAHDRLRDVSNGLAGEMTDWRMSNDWIKVCPILRSALASKFHHLANEELPDYEYWHGPKDGTIDPEKRAHLQKWVAAIEEEYGPTLEVPDLHPIISRCLQQQHTGMRR